MQFLPWHQNSFTRFYELHEKQRLPHAILLEGAGGTGRNAFAELIARHVLCASATSAGPCGQCKPCGLLESGSHPDIHRVLPEEVGKAIGIAAVRAAIDFASRTASTGTHKVLIISPTESMTTSAFNAFLKCLEEPAANTLILMVFAQGYRIPATIRSRCQRWPLPMPDPADIQQWLESSVESYADDETNWAKLLKLADNRPMIARHWMDNPETSQALLAFTQSMDSDSRSLAQIERAAAELEPALFLDVLERRLQTEVRASQAADLRVQRGKSLISALDVLQKLRRALRAGTNPNPDLLRLTAIDACRALWSV